MDNLLRLGWNDHFAEQSSAYAADGLVAARVCSAQKQGFSLQGQQGEFSGIITGKFRYKIRNPHDYPVVGDWVATKPPNPQGQAVIQAILPRQSQIVRKTPGVKTEEQLIAANVDTLLLVIGLNEDYNLRRLERYLTMAAESKVEGVIILNKVDLCEDIETILDEVRAVAGSMPVLTTSATNNTNINDIIGRIPPCRTAALVGSSGVGKSTIINALLGEDLLPVCEVREIDGRGRHTTTSRDLIMLPHGGMIIDNPGIRELQLWTDESTLQEAFGDIEELALKCYYPNCQHVTESDCAVQLAVQEGRLLSARYESYLKLQQELRELSIRQEDYSRQLSKARWKRGTHITPSRPKRKPN